MEKDKETLDAIKVFYSKIEKPLNPDDAATLAMDVSVKQNPTYSDGVDHKEIREYWSRKLIALLPKYQKAKPVRVSSFIRDVRIMKVKMNSRFPKSFINTGRGDDDDFDKEFRIAHAQKSLSIFLKHMWCITDNMPEPPVCPIDGNILKAIRNNDTWTKLNDIAIYKTYLNQVRDVAKSNNMSPAKWELVAWNQQSEKKTKVKKENNTQRKKQTSVAFPLPTNLNLSVEPYIPFYKLNSNRIHHDEFVVGFIIPLKEDNTDDEKKFMLFVAHHDNGYFCQIRYCYDNIDILDFRPFCKITQNKDGIEWKRSSKAVPTFKFVEFGEKKKDALCLMQNILNDVNAPQDVMEEIKKLVDECQ